MNKLTNKFQKKNNENNNNDFIYNNTKPNIYIYIFTKYK